VQPRQERPPKQLRANIGHGTDRDAGNNAQSVPNERVARPIAVCEKQWVGRENDGGIMPAPSVSHSVRLLASRANTLWLHR
tara:strand:- start:5216 stop:5458 length:243 start_codon:yes stop_codon:yes gene_type:complete